MEHPRSMMERTGRSFPGPTMTASAHTQDTEVDAGAQERQRRRLPRGVVIPRYRLNLNFHFTILRLPQSTAETSMKTLFSVIVAITVARLLQGIVYGFETNYMVWLGRAAIAAEFAGVTAKLGWLACTRSMKSRAAGA